METLIIICITIFLISLIISLVVRDIIITKSNPQFNCNHEMKTIRTWNGEYSQEYLSTCKKCGFQKTNYFSGTN